MLAPSCGPHAAAAGILGHPKESAVSLSAQSVNEALIKRTRRARVDVEAAEERLKAANALLEKAIPRGDTPRIEAAHEDTVQAEEAVERANEELRVVETLLEVKSSDEENPHESSGEGLKSLVRLLHRKQPRTPADDEA
jgi:hypothetical protein